jgi:hypothetical protein
VFLFNLLPGFRGFGKALGVVFQMSSLHFLAAAVLFAWIARLALRESRPTFPSSARVC